MRAFSTLCHGCCGRRPGYVLEFGSGATTELIAHYVKEHAQAQAMSLEHDGDWHRIMSARVPDHHLLWRPLVDRFYDMQGIDADFDLVLVDGPSGNRRGALQFVPDLLAPEFVVIVDDAHKSDHRAESALPNSSSQRSWLAGRESAAALSAQRKHRW